MEYIKFIEEDGKTIKSVITPELVNEYKHITVGCHLVIDEIIFKVARKYYNLDTNELTYHIY